MPTEPEGLWRGSRAWHWHWQRASDGDYVPKEDRMGFKSTHLPHLHIFYFYFGGGVGEQSEMYCVGDVSYKYVVLTLPMLYLLVWTM